MTAQADREGDLREVIDRHERDVRGFMGDISAADAHGNADIGHGQRGCVIDAVADHGDAAAAPVASTIGCRSTPSVREELRPLTSSRPSLPAICIATRWLLAGEHDDFFHAEAAQVANRFIGPRAEGIGHANRAADLAIVEGDDNGGMTFVVMFVHVSVQCLAHGNQLIVHQPRLADDEFLAVALGDNAAAMVRLNCDGSAVERPRETALRMIARATGCALIFSATAAISTISVSVNGHQIARRA